MVRPFVVVAIEVFIAIVGFIGLGVGDAILTMPKEIRF